MFASSWLSFTPVHHFQLERHVCGIFGWAVAAREARSEAELIKATEIMRHRGPDDEGHFVHTTVDQRFQLGFGFRRLAIIEVGATGAQPMRSHDNRFDIVFNGEIYNFVELRNELAARGHIFTTASDTEVLMEAFRAWGKDSVHKLRGMFAFAIWDHFSQQLTIARDHFGKKPLFIFQAADKFVFSSEIAGLLSFPGVPRALNHDAIGPYLFNRYVPAPETFFRCIHKLLPGSFCEWKDGNVTVSRYFTPPVPQGSNASLTIHEAAEQLKYALDESVRIRMRSDVPVAAFLSGGLDSSAVVASMAANASGSVRTFSAGFDDERYSELGYAKLVSKAFGTDHCELIVKPGQLYSNWGQAIIHRASPLTDPADVVMLLLSKEASKSAKVILSGEGADEMMAGYPKHQGEKWVQEYQTMFPPWLHNQIIHPLISSVPRMRRLNILSTACVERDPDRRLMAWFGGVTSAELTALSGKASFNLSDQQPFCSGSNSRLRQMLFFDQSSWLPDNLLERADRMMMAASIEGRMPFMDTKLAAVVSNFPDSFLVKGRGGKRVLRAAFAGILPKEILTRKKVGFRVPIEEWISGPLNVQFSELLRDGSSRIAKLINPVSWNPQIIGQRQLPGGLRTIWTLANLELFLRTFDLDPAV